MNTPATIQLRDATLSFGQRVLWENLNLDVAPGRFITVLGPNGAGKSSLLKVILGVQHLTAGAVMVNGRQVHKGSKAIGYIPQHRPLDPETPLRGGDLVQLGIDGNRWGLPRLRPSGRVHSLLDRVDAASLTKVPVGQMSGGEQQQLRIAQALATDPDVLLCDEPLLSLDLRHQQRVVEVLQRQCREHNTSVLFVTHEINPVLPVTDEVLYLAGGSFRLGTPDEVMTSSVLSDLYDAPIDVIRRGNRIIVLGAEESAACDHDSAEPTAMGEVL